MLEKEFEELNEYRENNRIEVKKAACGLPLSVWETYSSFANTYGGVILLGVTEKKNKEFKVTGVTDPKQMIDVFWSTINNRKKTSINILSDKDVVIKDIGGKQIIEINVPRADRSHRPIYLDGNPLNCFRRNGEGDYKCTIEEYRAMTRDSSVGTQDLRILEEMTMSSLNATSVESFRRRMSFARPGHVWERLNNEQFLQRIGASGIGKDGKIHPTAAGLLMFGNEYEIVKEYNLYFLDYQEQCDENNRWTDRVISSSGDWSGNVYDFFFLVFNKLKQSIKTPFKLDGITRVEDTPVHQAIREALANCLVNADYYGRRGVVITRYPDSIEMSNPGNSRIDIGAAISGGVSDPRNSTMLKMFNFIDIGERAGSGIPNIYKVWAENKWDIPKISEEVDPERFNLSLAFKKTSDKFVSTSDKSASTSDKSESASDKSAQTSDKSVKASDKFVAASDKFVSASDKSAQASDKSASTSDKFVSTSDKFVATSDKFVAASDKFVTTSDKSVAASDKSVSASDKFVTTSDKSVSTSDKSVSTSDKNQKAEILIYITKRKEVKTKEVAEYLKVSNPRARAVISELVSDKILIPVGAKKNRTYRLFNQSASGGLCSAENLTKK